MSDWRKERIASIANGLHIDRDEIEQFIGTATATTGDVTAMVPFNRAKPKSDEPATRLADMSDVARAKSAAMDYTDDMFARAAKRMQALEDARKGAVAAAFSPAAYSFTNYPPAAVTGPVYFAAVDDSNALVVENVRLRGERDNFRDRMYRQAETINAMQGEVNGLNATIANLEREREHIREGREKAVARCVELDEKLKGAREGWEKAVDRSIELEDANRYLHTLLSKNL